MWWASDCHTFTVVTAGSDGDHHADGLLGINRESQGRTASRPRSAGKEIRVPDAGTLEITKAPLGPSVETWAQKRGNIEFKGETGVTGTLHLRDDSVTIDRSRGGSRHIIESFNARLVSIQVVHVHWRLARPAVLSLNVVGAHNNGSTRGGASGTFPLPPSGSAHGRAASAGPGHAHLNFEFGDYDFNDSPKVQFTLVARSGAVRDRSQPITLARKPSA